MSTFTDGWNGPNEGFNYVLFRKCIEELRTELKALADKLPAGSFNTSDNTVVKAIAAVNNKIPPIEQQLQDLESAITTKKLTIADGATKILDAYKDVFTIHQDLIAANINVKDIKAGPTLIFDKYWAANGTTAVVVDSGNFKDFYVLAELVRVKPTNESATITYPCTLYVYNNSDPKVSAVIYATETGLAVLHSGRDFPASGTPGDPPLVKYAVVRTGSDDNTYHYYVCMIIYQLGTTYVTLANTSLKVAMINAKPVTGPVSGVGMAAGDVVQTTRSSDFLVTHVGSMSELDIKALHATTVEVQNTTTLKGPTTIGTSDAKTSLVINGTETVNGTLTTDDLVVKNLTNSKTIATEQLTATTQVQTPLVMSMSSEPMIRANGTQVTVGALSRHLELESADRPTVNDKGTKQEVAYRTDLISSIIYKGPYLLYSEGAPAYVDKIRINDNSDPDDPDNYYILHNGDACLALMEGPARPDGVTEFQIARVYYYALATKTWTTADKDIIPHPPHDQTYQWHITYLKQGTDLYFHQSEVLWNPDLAPSEIVSYINLPLEDYYTKEQVERIVDMFYDLSTRQADWFATDRTSSDDVRGNGIDNPAYIRNKPLTGMSVLDGGAFVDPDVQLNYPQWIVDGGDFNELGKSRGTVETYDDMIATPVGDDWEEHDYMYVRQDKFYSYSSTRYKITAISSTVPRIAAWAIDRVVNDIGNLRQDVIYKLWSGLKKELPPGNAKTKFALKWCYNTRELFIDMHGETPDASFVDGNRLLSSPLLTALYNASIAQGTDIDPTDSRVLSAVQTFDLFKSSGNETIKFKLSAGDARLSFGPVSTEQDGTYVLPVSVYTADFRRMLDPSSVATYAATFTSGALTVTWQTKTYNTMYITDTKTENLSFLSGTGIMFVYDDSVLTAKKLTIQLDTDTQAALNNNVVLSSTYDSAATGAKITTVGNKLYDPQTPDVTTSLLINTDGTLQMVASGTATDKITTLGLHAVITSQDYVKDTKTEYDATDPAKGLSITLTKRTIGSSTMTQKKISLLPGANMTFVEASGSTPDDFKLQLNATSVIPPFSYVNFKTDPAAVLGIFTYARSGQLVNGTFNITNAGTGVNEGQFQEKLAVSLRPLTPIEFEYGDTTGGSTQYLKLATDGTVSFKLGSTGSRLTVPLMYFGQ
jgi:hypothetical protein